MTCEYCKLEIDDQKYVYKWFPEKKLMYPVHAFHLTYEEGVRRALSTDDDQGKGTTIPPRYTVKKP